MSSTHILTLSCPDRLGLVHAVSGFLLARDGNIEEAAQFNDSDTGLFFMRVRFQFDGAIDLLRTDWANKTSLVCSIGICQILSQPPLLGLREPRHPHIASHAAGAVATYAIQICLRRWPPVRP